MRNIRLNTPVELPKSNFGVSYHNRLLSLGSCFSSNIAEYFKLLRFHIVYNPFGPLYNPISIARCLDRLQSGQPFGAQELFYFGGLYHSELHHGSFSKTTIEETINVINTSLEEARNMYEQCDRLIVTFGTSRVYRQISTGIVVGNCHKQPQSLFSQEDLPLDDMCSEWGNLLTKIMEDKPHLKVILTVSPIRHLGDGLVANARSKSKLLLLCDYLAGLCPSRIEYFPSFEIMMDELRDYRYYAQDMKHPSDLAIEIICQRFLNQYINEETFLIFREVEAYNKLKSHRIMHEGSEEAQKHLSEIEARAHCLKKKYPFLCL